MAERACDAECSLDECSICLDKIKNVSILPCQHHFCFTCVILWSAERLECPLCQRPYSNVRAMKMDITLVAEKIEGKVRDQSSDSSQEELECHEVLSSHVLSDRLVDICMAAAFCNPAILQYRQSLYHEDRWTDSALSSVYFTVPYLQKNPKFVTKLKQLIVRELSVLLHEKSQICFVAELVFQLLSKFEIRSNAFETRLKPFLLPHILQFLNEVYHFASTPLIRHDLGTECCKTEIHALSGIIKTEIEDDDSGPSTSSCSNAKYSASASEKFENMLSIRSFVSRFFTESVLSRRNHVYKYNLWSKLNYSTIKYEQIIPSFLKKHTPYVIRLIPWLVRELFVILRDLGQVHDVLHIVIALLITHELWSEEFHRQLHPHLSGLTRHFIHELFHISSTSCFVWDYEVFASYEYREYSASSSFNSVPVQFRPDFLNKIFPVYHQEGSSSSDGNSLFIPDKAGPSFDIPLVAAKNSMDILLFIKKFLQSPEDRPVNLRPPYCRNASHSIPCTLAIPACIFSSEALSSSQAMSNVTNIQESNNSDVDYVDLVSDSENSSDTIVEEPCLTSLPPLRPIKESSEEVDEPQRSKKQCLRSPPELRPIEENSDESEEPQSSKKPCLRSPPHLRPRKR